MATVITTASVCLSCSGLKSPSTVISLKPITKTHYYGLTLGQRSFLASDNASCSTLGQRSFLASDNASCSCIRVPLILFSDSASLSKVSKPSSYDIDEQSINPLLMDFDDFPPFDLDKIEHDLVKLSQKFGEKVFDIDMDWPSSWDIDNMPIIEEILALRYEKAKIFEYNNFAEFKMKTHMADVDKAHELLEKLRIVSWDLAIQETEELKQFAMSLREGGSESDHLDLSSEVSLEMDLIISKYGIDLEDKCEYFSLSNVLDGLFNLAKTLFGISVEPADGLAPVWNKDVMFFRVDDISTGSSRTIAYFYFDPYPRPDKRDGAWVDKVVNSVLDGHSSRLPIFHMICSIDDDDDDDDDDDKSSLMTFDDVKTIFNEFGKLLHAMLKKGELERDANKLPSKFMENWCYHRETFMNIAKHYETGENPPEAIYEKFLDFRTFRSGCRILYEIKQALVDLELHTKYVPGGSESIYDICHRVTQRTQIPPPPQADKFLHSFCHIFACGHAAGYYSYLWSEVLAADAFSAFEEAGLSNENSIQELGKMFRKAILAVEGKRGALEAFVDFRGREPCIQAFLRHNGMLSVTARPVNEPNHTEHHRV